MMNEHPAVHLEDGSISTQWLQKKQTILDQTEWSGDWE